MLVLAAILPCAGAEAQKITPDANAFIQLSWDGAQISDGMGNTDWGMHGFVPQVGPAFGYAGGAGPFSLTNFYAMGNQFPKPEWDIRQAPYSIMDTLVPIDWEACTTGTGPCWGESPAFTGVLVFSIPDGTMNHSEMLLSTSSAWSGPDGWYLYHWGPMRMVRFYAALLNQGNTWIFSSDTQGLNTGTGLQVVCFGITEDLRTLIKANGRSAVISSAQGETWPVCSCEDTGSEIDPNTGLPIDYQQCIDEEWCVQTFNFWYSYGPSFLGVEDGIDGPPYGAATHDVYYEYYQTTTPASDELCADLTAQVLGT
jgi:hypothetical protein